MPWYHVSERWKGPLRFVVPRAGRVDDVDDPRELVPFISVAPSIVQCLIGVGVWRDYAYMSKFHEVSVYEASSEIEPEPVEYVFDYSVTKEHRFRQTTAFSRVGKLDIASIASLIKPRDLAGIADDCVLMKEIRADYFDLLELNMEDFLDRNA